MPSALSYAIPGAMNAQNRNGYDSSMKGLIDQYNYLYPTVQDEQARDVQNHKGNESPMLGSPGVFGGEYEYRRDANDESSLADVVSKLQGRGGVQRQGGYGGGGGASMMAPPSSGGYDAVGEQQDRDQQQHWLGQAAIRSANAGADFNESRAMDATFGDDERRQNAVGDATLAGQAAVANYNTTAPIREGQQADAERLFQARYGDPARIRADAGIAEHQIDADGKLATAGVPRTINNTQSRSTNDPAKDIDALTKYKASLTPADPGKTSFWGSWGGARPPNTYDQPKIDRVNERIESLMQGPLGATETQTEQQQGTPITLAQARQVADRPENRWTDDELKRRLMIHGYYISDLPAGQ